MSLMIQEASSKDQSDHQCKQRRRLMFVIEALTVGGAEQLVVDLANEFAQQGEYVHVVCLSKPGELVDLLVPEVKVTILDKRPGIDLRISRKLRNLVKSDNISIVNSHLWTANLWTRIALVKSGIPVVATEHNRDVWKRAHNRTIDRILSYATAKLIAVSEDTASYYRRDVGIRSSLITVINNGIDTARYANGSGIKLRSSLARETDFLVGSVGRLAKAKNHPRLIAATEMVKQKGIPIQVVIVGEGPERLATEMKISKLGLEDCVKLLGVRTDIPDLLAALDVFVLSSDREGHPLSALEAQAAGTPVILTKAGGNADAVSRSDQGCGGILVDCTPAALADGLYQLATDHEKRKEMGRFAKAYAAAQFDKSKMINSYSELFDSVLA
ncbi:MAG: glycosyltransferase [Granulosicoccus sp.]|nr:glycosyltransferase [Granulosicoccus sp.]